MIYSAKLLFPQYEEKIFYQHYALVDVTIIDERMITQATKPAETFDSPSLFTARSLRIVHSPLRRHALARKFYLLIGIAVEIFSIERCRALAIE